MVKNSVIYTVVLFIYGVITESGAFRLFTGMLRTVGRWLSESMPGRLLLRTGCTESYAKGSRFYRGVEAVWQGVLRIFSRFYGFISAKNTDSINRRFFDGVLQGSYIFRPETLLGLSCLAIFLVPHAAWNNLYASLAIVFLCGLYFLRLLSGKAPLGKSAYGLWLPFLLFVGATALAVIASPAMGDSLRTLAFFLTAFLACLLLYGTLHSYQTVERLLFFMVLAVGISAVYAVIQRVMGVAQDASLTDLTLNPDMPGRVTGTLGNPNNYAEFLMLFLPFVFAYATSRAKVLPRLLGFGALLLGVVALILTYSRSGWIAFAVAILVYVTLYNWRLLPFVVLAAIFAVPLLPTSVLNRILTIGNLADSSSSYRIDIWTGSLRMLRDGYWFAGTGLGSGAFTSVYPAYAVGASRIAPHTHMQFMEMLAETGILGLTSILWLSVSLVRRTAISIRRADKRLKSVLCAAAASISGITAIGFAEYTWFYPRVMLAFFIVSGIAMACVRIATKE